MAPGKCRTVRRRLVLAGLLSGCLVLVAPSMADALAITVPGAVNLGAGPTGTSRLSAQQGTVTATDSGTLLLLPSFTATVSSTDFATGGVTAAEKIPKASVSYWSGAATASSGAQTPVPGQATSLQAQSL